jgi:putative spermidine/putrescine transport system permease protein
MTRVGRLVIPLGLTLLYGFVLAPIMLVILISFSADNFLRFPPEHWGIRWYRTLLQNATFLSAFRTSAILAATVTMFDLAVGIPAAYAIARMRFRGRDALFAFLTAPLLLPSVVLGLSILLAFAPLKLVATYPGLTLAHMAITLPFVVRIIATALSTLPPDVEDAAATLGAPPRQVFRRVTLPLMIPGVLGASALAFILSFDEVVISLFIVGPRLSTLPVEIFRYVEGRTDPMVAALCSVLIFGSIGIVLVLERTVGFLRAVSK